MKSIGIAVLLVLTTGIAAGRAQNPQVQPVNPPPESLRMMPQEPAGARRPDPERVRQMRRQVEERFGQMVQAQLELNDADMQRLRVAMRANQDRHQAFMRREMDTQRAIRGQMEPGVAANNDSLNRYMSELSRIRIERAQSDDQFQRDLAFLTPVKRVRLMQMMRNFEERVRDIAEQRQQRGMRRPDPREGVVPPGTGERVRPMPDRRPLQ